MNQNTVLWIYVVLLLVGGLFGYFKAKSRVSLITSTISAALLILTAIPLFQPPVARLIADVIMALLLVVFSIRLVKTRKFMPSGMMLITTVVALALRHIHF